MYCRPLPENLAYLSNNIDPIERECYYTAIDLCQHADKTFYSAQGYGTRMSHSYTVGFQNPIIAKMYSMTTPYDDINVKPQGLFYIESKNREYLVWANVSMSSHRNLYRLLTKNIFQSFVVVFDDNDS